MGQKEDLDRQFGQSRRLSFVILFEGQDSFDVFRCGSDISTMATKLSL